MHRGCVGMVEIPHGPLAPNRRQWTVEALGWWRRRRVPLERLAVPWVVARDLAMRARTPHVPEEREHREAEDHRADRRDHVQRSPAVCLAVAANTAGHAVEAEDVL